MVIWAASVVTVTLSACVPKGQLDVHLLPFAGLQHELLHGLIAEARLFNGHDIPSGRQQRQDVMPVGRGQSLHPKPGQDVIRADFGAGDDSARGIGGKPADGGGDRLSVENAGQQGAAKDGSNH
jgi:hypothetical protein